MFEKTVLLSNFTKVKSFVALASSLPYEVSLVEGKKRVDAKSMVGIFSLDLTKPLTVIADTDSVAILSKKLEPFALKKG